MRHIFIFLLLLQFSILAASEALGQVRPLTPVIPQDTLTSGLDTVTVNMPRGDIETTIKYSARDSIQFEVDRKVVHLYGDAKINYGEISLDAAYIEIDYESNTLTATPLADSTGKDVGVPVFVQGSEKYQARRIAFNYKTKRGRIAEVVTQQGEGYIHSEVVKRNENNEFFGLHNKYTTCNLEHPHFYINASRIKAIPNEKVMAGPFNLVIGDIPTPVGFLFGLFPTPKTERRASGIIVPSFGESRAQGFYLRQGGYYFAWNDYIGTRIVGDIYSLGGYNINIDNTYRNRYSYSGNFNLSYTSFKNDEADRQRSASTNEPIMQPSAKTFWVNWSHSPVQKPGRGRFSASVNAGSALHQRLRYTNTTQYLSPTFNSNITYQKNITNTPFSYTIKASQGQSNSGAMNRGPAIMNFVLPDLNFSMSQTSLYELITNATPTGEWYEQFTIGYNVTARNEVSNLVQPRSVSLGVPIMGERPQADTLNINFDNIPELWRSGRRSANHNFSIGLGSYKVFRYLNLSPSVSYSEDWVDRKYTYRFNADSQQVEVIDTSRFGRIYQYNAAASLSTTIYGTVYVKGKRVEAIRHLMRPQISYSYRPDFGDERFGFYQNIQTGTDIINNQEVPRFGLVPRFATNLPGTGLQSAMNFSVQNNLEMKVRSKNTDTTSSKTTFEKVSLINNLGINGSYNFAADSMKLSNISMNMNTTLFKFINVNFTSTFDPYTVGSRVRNGRTEYMRVDEYYFDISKLRLARLTNANLSLTASLNPEARRSETTAPTNLPDLQQEVNPFLPDYVDFKIPWTLNLDFTLFYSRGLPNTPSTINKTFGVNGSVNLTEKWKITYNANYDFTNNNIAYSQVSIYRDLHCWDMSITWIPFGFQRGYNFTINARSSLLRDLKLSRNRTGWNR